MKDEKYFMAEIREEVTDFFGLIQANFTSILNVKKFKIPSQK